MKRRSVLPVALPALLVSHAVWAFAQEIRTIQYEYTIEVRSVGPAAAKPATVELRWPKGTRTLSLSGSLASETVTIEWEEHPPTGRELAPKRVRFALDVAVAREGFRPWRAEYIEWDFVRVRDDLFRLMDKVTLQAVPPGVTEAQLAELSLALPCGLDIYTQQRFADFDKDGRPEAILSRGVHPWSSSSPGAELQIWSLRGGRWVALLVANHRGIVISGEPVEGTGPAPHGYRYRGVGEPGPGDIATTGEAYLGVVDLCRGDSDGEAVRAEARSYVWRKGTDRFSPQPVRRRMPK